MVAVTSPDTVDTRDPHDADVMRTRDKVLLGGVGALMPTIAVFLASEGATIDSFDEPASFIGYGLRVVLLFLIGSLWVWLHKTEHDPAKVFPLGVVAPAMITGVIQAENISGPARTVEVASPTPVVVALASAAYLADGPVLRLPAAQTRPGSPKPTTFRCIVKGFLGRKC